MIQTLGLAPAHIVTSPAIDSFAYLDNFGPSHTLLRPSQASGSMVKQSPGAAAAAARKPITTIRVGCDFSGLGTFMLAMRKTHAKLQTGKYKVQHCFSSDKMRAAKKLMMHTDPPDVFYADVKSRNLKDMARTDVYSFTAPCVTFSTAGKSQGVNDQKGLGALMLNSLAYIGQHLPKVVVAENVASLTAPRHRLHHHPIHNMLL